MAWFFLSAVGVWHAGATETQHRDDGGGRRSPLHPRVPTSGEKATHVQACWFKGLESLNLQLWFHESNVVVFWLDRPFHQGCTMETQTNILESNCSELCHVESNKYLKTDLRAKQKLENGFVFALRLDGGFNFSNSTFASWRECPRFETKLRVFL